MPIAISSGSAIRPASLPCCWRGSKIDHWRSLDGCATILQDPHWSHGRVLVLAEFLAIHQSDATLLGCVLRRLAGKVSLGSSERAAGVGFFQSDDLLLRKRPLGGQPALPEKLADGVESEATLICSGAVGTTTSPAPTPRPARSRPRSARRSARSSRSASRCPAWRRW